MLILGELYTWGKGRYGRLGHGDSEDQLKPKLVEALHGFRVIDVACGKKFVAFFLAPFAIFGFDALFCGGLFLNLRMFRRVLGSKT